MTTVVLVVALHLIAVTLVIVLLAVLKRRRDLERKLAAADAAAHTDNLTGLANRAGLRRRLAAQRAADTGGVSGLVLLNIDGLRSINEQHGHVVGDAVIVEVARRIAKPRARVVCCARLGGDDFAVLLEPHPNPTRASQDAEQVAYGLCAGIAAPLVAADVSLNITASAGVATLPTSQVDRLLPAADMAMYRAKTKGLGICRYQPIVDGPADARQRPRVRLRDLRNQTGNDARWTMRTSAREWFERPEVS